STSTAALRLCLADGSETVWSSVIVSKKPSDPLILPHLGRAFNQYHSSKTLLPLSKNVPGIRLLINCNPY
ncbi:MAG: hypothetical protein KAR47_10340, partial [Planctomycetes bacterium]|nr:hypothetical protein [Planctomycetota bacterium]